MSRSVFAVATAAIVALASPAWAGTVTFADGDFDLAGYQITEDTRPGYLSFSEQTTFSDGNKAYHSFYRTIGENPPGFRFRLLGNSFIYDPSTQGAITSIDASIREAYRLYHNDSVLAYDRIGLGLRLTAIQGGVLYGSRQPAESVRSNAFVWIDTARTGLAAGDFQRVVDTDGVLTFDPTQTLDFTGGEIQFGFDIAHYGTTNTVNYIDSDHFVDSFSLTLHTGDVVAPPPAVPEPASWAMLIAGFGLIGGAMRRRGAMPALS